MKKIIILLLTCLLLGSQCIDNTSKLILRVNNRSNHKIMVGQSYIREKPDTLIGAKNRDILLSEIKPQQEGWIWMKFSNWEDIFASKDTIRIFVFHADTVDKYPWEVIRKEYKILKRYDLTRKDIPILKQNGNILVYP